MSHPKGRLGADIDQETLQKFKQIVLCKHGKLRGKISIEIEDALKLYIKKYEEAR